MPFPEALLGEHPPEGFGRPTADRHRLLPLPRLPLATAPWAAPLLLRRPITHRYQSPTGDPHPVLRSGGTPFLKTARTTCGAWSDDLAILRSDTAPCSPAHQSVELRRGLETVETNRQEPTLERHPRIRPENSPNRRARHRNRRWARRGGELRLSDPSFTVALDEADAAVSPALGD